MKILLTIILLLISYAAIAGFLPLLGAGKGGSGGVGPTNFLLLSDGTSYLLLADGTSRLCLANGC